MARATMYSRRFLIGMLRALSRALRTRKTKMRSREKTVIKMWSTIHPDRATITDSNPIGIAQKKRASSWDCAPD